MAVVQVQPNGNAPAGLKTGTTVATAGGKTYTIVAPGTPGSTYNPKSGYSSIDNSNLPALINYNSQQQSEKNSAQSQANAREQMKYQTESNAKAMSFSAEQAEINRAWQEKMSSTAHQREVGDLIKAGLNPVLSANYGGSSTPSGSSAYGVTSGGSQGQVDNSSNQILGTLLNAIVSQATALQTTSMNNSTALQTSQMGANAMLGTASINARSNQYMQGIQNDFEEYLKKNYPQNVVGGVSASIQNLIDLLSGTPQSGKNAEKMDQFIKNVISGWGLIPD